MSLLDELQDYAQGEEPVSPEDAALIDGALAQAHASSGATVGAWIAGGVVVAVVLAVALWPRDEPAPAAHAPSSVTSPPGGSSADLLPGASPSPPSKISAAPAGSSADLPPSASPSSAPKTPAPADPAIVDAPAGSRSDASAPQARPPTHDAVPPAHAPPPVRGTSKPSLNALLERAQARRAATDYGESVSIYRRAIRLYPRVPAARRALVTLGDIELHHRRRPSAALAAFERYLKLGSDPVLAQEAAYGRIRALRALGRDAKEANAIDAFLSEHAQSPYRAALTRRREKLDTPTEPSAAPTP